jgi:hypothetical protein
MIPQRPTFPIHTHTADSAAPSGAESNAVTIPAEACYVRVWLPDDGTVTIWEGASGWWVRGAQQTADSATNGRIVSVPVTQARDSELAVYVQFSGSGTVRLGFEGARR